MSDLNTESIADAVTDDAFDQALGGEPDVLEDTSDPASPSESVVDAPEADPAEVPAEETKVETVEELPDEVETSQETLADVESLNWESAPEQFREKYKSLKGELAEAQANSLKDKYFSDPQAFLDELSGLSTSQFQQTAQQIVKRGIDEMPDDYAAYLAQVAPDAVAKSLSGISPDVLAQTLFGDGVSAQKVQKIIAQVKAQDLEEFLNDNDEAPKTSQPKSDEQPKAMTPDDIERLVTQRLAEADKPKQIEALEQRTYADIIKPVEGLLAHANLMPQDTDSVEDKKFKERISAMVIRDTFDYLVDNEKNQPRAAKMFEMIQSLDESGVKHLANSAKIIAEDHAGELIEMLTANRAKELRKPATKPKEPPRVVPTSGTIPSFGNPIANGAGRISDISESDFESAGM